MLLLDNWLESWLPTQPEYRMSANASATHALVRLYGSTTTFLANFASFKIVFCLEGSAITYSASLLAEMRGSW